MIARFIGLICVMCLTTAAVAEAPKRSKRPVLRPVLEATSVRPPSPKLRPDVHLRTPTTAVVEKVVIEQTIAEDRARRVAATRSLASARDQEAAVMRRVSRPKNRPANLRVTLRKAETSRQTQKPVGYARKGSVCGVRGIRGYAVSRVHGKGGCGIASPVKVTEIDGVKLTREALIGCDAAKTLYGWVHNKAKPIVGGRGGGLAKIQLIGSYACRNRNSAKNGRLSEHAKGNAMDIAGFILKDGSTLSVLRGWRSSGQGPTLKRLHKAACGTFKTVLGPNANRFHQDHFHFDVAKHRGGGSYCK